MVIYNTNVIDYEYVSPYHGIPSQSSQAVKREPFIEQATKVNQFSTNVHARRVWSYLFKERSPPSATRQECCFEHEALLIQL